MRRTQTLPIQAFSQLFTSWGDNSGLSIQRLRLKTVVLLALTLMLRPSDIAPAGVMFNPLTLTYEPIIFSTRHITFPDDGSAVIKFFGIKNDSDRSGFQCTLPPCTNSVLDPVGTLQNYILRTATIRNTVPSSPVFVTLQKPYKHLTASGISAILRQAISLAGLDGQSFTPRCFRPTGAQAAVDNKVDPKVAQQHGRWRSETIFYTHYVHAKPPTDFCANVLSHT